MKANTIIKQYARDHGVFLWEVAERFGLGDNQFSKKLRHEFSEEDRALAMQYIDEIAQAKKEEVAG